MDRDAFCNRRMLLSVGLAVILLGHTYLRNPDIAGIDVLYIISLPMATAMFGAYACVFPALPYATRFVEEYNSSFSRFILIRSSRIRYAVCKSVSIAFSGGLMMAEAFTIIFGIAVLIGKPSTGYDPSVPYGGTIWYVLIPVWGGKCVLLLKILLAFIFGMVWSSVCLLLSVFFLNRYVAFIGTFILYQFLWQFLSSSKWNPVYLLRADIQGYSAVWEPFAIQLLIFLTLLLCNTLVIVRRLRDV